jgi:hypothetical protein
LAALYQALPPGKTFPTSPYYQQLQADIHFEFGRAWAAKGDAREAIAAYLRCLSLDASRAAAPQSCRVVPEQETLCTPPSSAMAEKLAGGK